MALAARMGMRIDHGRTNRAHSSNPDLDGAIFASISDWFIFLLAWDRGRYSR